MEQDYGLAKNLALKYLSADNYDKAIPLFKEAVELAKTPSEKSEMLIYLGSIEAKRGTKSGAREIFRQAAAADPSNKEPYEKIGDLYMNSVADCSKQKSLAEDRLVYIAAYDMYLRAGNNAKMAQAKSQFPSTTEIFEQDWKEGDSKRIDCWVGETVSLKTRGKD
ncbi:MAG: tetratricopeptide repeat protein [Flammeovirgaceae bacterium]|nr:tetratricopeptide repeat protein [Flammeovirgaceae bacterium]